MTLQPAIVTSYDEALFEDNFPAGIEDHYWFAARNAVLDRTLTLARRRGWIPAVPKILEVGCGTGIVVDALGRRGHDIQGVELGRPPRSLAPDRVRSGLRAQDLEPELRAEIDALMFLDVIEHVPDDVALLRETLEAFPRCRAVFVSVPARPELWSDHDRYYGHYRRYTRGSLAKTMRAADLEPVSSRYLFRSLYAAAASITLSGRQRKPVMTSPRNRSLHGLVAKALVLEDAILGALPIPGLSVLAVGLRRQG